MLAVDGNELIGAFDRYCHALLPEVNVIVEYINRLFNKRSELDGLKVCLAYLIAQEMKRRGESKLPDDLMDVCAIKEINAHTWVFSFFGNNHPAPHEVLEKRGLHGGAYPARYAKSAEMWSTAFGSAMSVFDMVKWFLEREEPPHPKNAIRWGTYWNIGRYFPDRWLDHRRQ